MPWLGTITVVGLVALAVLIWLYLRFRSQDVLDALTAKRRASSKVISRAQYAEGLEKLPVVLCLTDDCIYYENADMEASLELAHLEEIEYDDETATGHAVHGGRALRLRSHGHTFEFILGHGDSARWETLLPSRRADQPRAQAV